MLAGRTRWACWSPLGVTASMSASMITLCVGPMIALALQPALANRRLKGEPGVPRKEDPGVLRHLGNESVDHRAAHRLGVNGGEVRLGQQVAHELGGLRSEE